MEATYENGVFIYKTEDYTFRFKKPKEQFYETLIVKPSNLKVITNLTEFKDNELLKQIVLDWFEDENESVRARNNEKRRAKTNNKEK